MEDLSTWLVGQTAAVVILGVGCYALWLLLRAEKIRNKELTDIIIQMTKDSTNAASAVANKLEDAIEFLKKHSK